MKTDGKFSKVILIILGIFLLAFTVTMIWLYLLTGDIPSTLCSCVFVALTGEAGFMGWIKTAKVKAMEREWKQEDQALKTQQEIEKLKKQPEVKYI